jgi:hypothetical protein
MNTFAQPSHTKTFDLPPGVAAPYRIGICADDGPLLFWSQDSSQPYSSTLYSFDLHTRGLHQLLKGTSGDLLCSPRPHVLCVQLRNGDATTLVVLEDSGKKIGELPNPEKGAFFFPQWTTDGGHIVYEAVDPDNPPNDLLAFSAVGVLNIPNWTHSLFPTHRDGFGLSLVTRAGKTHICTSLNDAEEPAKWRFTIRDLAGKPIELPKEETQELCTAQNRRYYASRQIELPQSFEIFRSKTREVVASFPGFDRKTNELLAPGGWSPANDDLIVIERRSNSNELQRVTLFRPSDSKVMYRIKTNAYAWTPSGEFIVYVSAGKFVFMRVAP